MARGETLKYDKAALTRALKERAKVVAGEVTAAFFDTVSDIMPVENGHAHATFGAGLMSCTILDGVEEVASSMLAKGSGDPEAESRGYGEVVETTKSVKVKVGTSVGFVKKLNDGATIYVGDLRGRTGPKVSRSDEGKLYAPRRDTGVGFLYWSTGGSGNIATYEFARSVDWGKLHFFEEASIAATQRANQLGAY